jgi:hypothetical protein
VPLVSAPGDRARVVLRGRSLTGDRVAVRADVDGAPLAPLELGASFEEIDLGVWTSPRRRRAPVLTLSALLRDASIELDYVLLLPLARPAASL